MDRMEILKLALASSPDAERALDLAQKMADFVEAPPRQQDAPAGGKPANAGKRWTTDELLQAAELIDSGMSIQQVADATQRTWGAIDNAWREKLIPATRPHLFHIRQAKSGEQVAP